MICTGKYGDIPMIPKFPQNKGPQVFQGKVLHTLDYCKLNEEESTELLKDKKVVIFGYKKSAIDLAVECAEANQGNYSTRIHTHIRTNTRKYTIHTNTHTLKCVKGKLQLSKQ